MTRVSIDGLMTWTLIAGKRSSAKTDPLPEDVANEPTHVKEWHDFRGGLLSTH